MVYYLGVGCPHARTFLKRAGVARPRHLKYLSPVSVCLGSPLLPAPAPAQPPKPPPGVSPFFTGSDRGKPLTPPHPHRRRGTQGVKRPSTSGLITAITPAYEVHASEGGEYSYTPAQKKAIRVSEQKTQGDNGNTNLTDNCFVQNTGISFTCQ